jgi:hypothetical protein
MKYRGHSKNNYLQATYRMIASLSQVIGICEVLLRASPTQASPGIAGHLGAPHSWAQQCSSRSHLRPCMTSKILDNYMKMHLCYVQGRA